MNPSGYTIQSLIDLHADTIPGQKYVVYPETGSSCTWKEFQQRVQSVACYLSGKGLSREVPIAGLLGNGQTALELLLGGMYGGFQVLLANPLSGRDILAYVIEHSETKILFVAHQYQDLAEQALSQLSKKPEIILNNHDNLPVWNDTVPVKKLLNHIPNPKDNALLIYTSGTTGRPKGAVLSHGNLLSSVRGLEIAWRWTPDDILILALPLFHMHGLGVGLHGSLAVGAKVVLLPEFDVDEVVDSITKFDATMFFGVPTMYSRLLESPEATELEQLRLCVSGSAPLPAELHQSIHRVTGQHVLERYGMTETAMLVSNPYEGERRPGSVGFPLPGVEVRLEGDPAEIQVKGPNVFSGYWERPEENTEAFVDGWFRTGDLGAIDPEGYLSIVGRAKELIISGGFNVYPREVEEVISEYEPIQECAVVGVPDEEWGEVVVAFVVAEREIEDEEIKIFVGERLAHYKRPRRTYTLERLPRNALGKVQKHRLMGQIET